MIVLDTTADLQRHRAKLRFLENEDGFLNGARRLEERFVAEDGKVLEEELPADRALENADRLVHKLEARIDTAGIKSGPHFVAIDFEMLVVGVNELEVHRADAREGIGDW